MGSITTLFTPHKDGDVIYAEHVNELQRAVQSGESRIATVDDDLFSQQALLVFTVMSDFAYMHVDTFKDTTKLGSLSGVALSLEDKEVVLRPGFTYGVCESVDIGPDAWGTVTSAQVLVDADPGGGSCVVSASCDGGQRWVDVPSSGIVTFPAPGGILKLRAVMRRPTELHESPKLRNWAIMWGVTGV